MSEHPILFSGPMVRAILEGRKTQTRRVIKPQLDFVYGLLDDIIYIIHTKTGQKETVYDSTEQRYSISTNPGIAKQRLYGRDRWADLLTNEIQRIWAQGVRGLVSASRPSDEQGLSFNINESQQYKSNQIDSSVGMFGVSRSSPRQILSGSALGRESGEQQAREFDLGDSSGELARQESSRDGERRGKTLGSQANRCGTGTPEMGYTKGAMQPKTRRSDFGAIPGGSIKYCPFQVGQTLWVREMWQAMNQERRWWHEVKREDRPLYNWAWTNPVYPAYESKPPKWLPSIHMPRAASRITLDVVSVRVERLQDISEGDAKAEGVEPYMSVCIDDASDVYRQGFRRLWQSINGNRPGCAWQDNPLVWVVEFAKR